MSLQLGINFGERVSRQTSRIEPLGTDRPRPVNREPIAKPIIDLQSDSALENPGLDPLAIERSGQRRITGQDFEDENFDPLEIMRRNPAQREAIQDLLEEDSKREVDQGALNEGAVAITEAALDLIEPIVIAELRERGVDLGDDFEQIRGKVDEGEAGRMVDLEGPMLTDVAGRFIRDRIIGPLVGEGGEPDAGKEVDAPRGANPSFVEEQFSQLRDGEIDPASVRLTVEDQTFRNDGTPFPSRIRVDFRRENGEAGAFIVADQEIARRFERLARRQNEERNERAIHQLRQQIEQDMRDESSEESRSGVCDCPNDRASDGSRCGDRCAWVKAGGRSPSCGRDPLGQISSGRRKIENNLRRISL